MVAVIGGNNIEINDVTPAQINGFNCVMFTIISVRIYMCTSEYFEMIREYLT